MTKSRFFPIAFFLVCAAPFCATAQQPGSFFQQNCSACHTIGGGRRVGPDLKDVTKRKDRPWRQEFNVSPDIQLAMNARPSSPSGTVSSGRPCSISKPMAAHHPR